MNYLINISRKLKITLLHLAAALIVLGVVGYTTDTVRAELDESNAVPFKKAEEKVGGFVEGTMIVGTFAMHRDVVTDQYMERAESTISDSGQSNTYYKSDLAGGVWYDITNAEGLSGIYDNGEVATNADMEELFLRYYVDGNGVLTDLLTGEMVNPYDIPNAYDIPNLPEMKPLTSAFNGLLRRQADENPGPQQYYRHKINMFYYAVNRHTAETNEIDRQINSIFNNMYIWFVNHKNYPEADKCMEVMEMLDAKRRTIVLEQLSQEVDDPPDLRHMDRDSELKPLMDSVGYKWRGNGRSFDEDREWMGDLMFGRPAESLGLLEIQLTGTGYITEHWDDVKFSNVDYIIDAIGECREEVSKSHIKYSSMVIGEGVDVRTRAYKSAYDALLAGLDSGPARDAALHDMMDISSVIDGHIKQKDRELSLITARLIPEADGIISGDFSRGAGESYHEGLGYGEKTPALKARLAQQRLDEPETHIGELQALILEQKKRVSAQDGFNLMIERLNYTDNWEKSIPSDAYASYALGALMDHREWLKLQARKILDDNEDLKGGVTDKEAKRRGLILDRDMALDDGDSELAKRIDDLIAQEDALINADIEKIMEEYYNATGTGDKTATGFDLGDDSVEGAINDMKGDVYSQIADNAGSGAGTDSGTGSGTGSGNLGLYDPNSRGGNAIGALGELGAEDALAEIADAVDKAGGSDRDKKSVAKAQEKAAEVSKGMGLGKATGYMDEERLLSLIESVMGKPFDKLDARGKIVAAVATAEFGRQFSLAAPIGRRLMKVCIDEKNPYGFYKIQDPKPEGRYTSIKAFAQAAGWRYEYRKNTHTLSYRGKYYEMDIGDDIILISDTEKKRLQGPLQAGPGLAHEDIPYLMDKDARALSKVTVEYVDSTRYGACFTESMESRKKELIQAFNDAIS